MILPIDEHVYEFALLNTEYFSDSRAFVILFRNRGFAHTNLVLLQRFPFCHTKLSEVSCLTDNDQVLIRYLDKASYFLFHNSDVTLLVAQCNFVHIGISDPDLQHESLLS